MPGNISTSLKNWSTTATSNQPDSGDAATVQADFQNVQAAVRSALADRQSIAAGSTVDLGSVDSLFVNVSSSGATITSFGTGTANLFRIVTFAGANTLTHNGTSLILPGASNITTAAGDSCLVEMLGSSNHKVHVYQKASGFPIGIDINGLTEDTSPDTTADFVATYDASATTNKKVKLSNLGTSSGGGTSARNYVINGSFKGQQCAIGTTDNSYVCDGWRVLMENANGVTTTFSSASVPGGAMWRLVGTVGSGNNGKFGYFHPIANADMQELRSQVISILAALKATAGLSDIRIGLMQWTGTADAISADPISSWNAAGTLPTLIANWAFINTPANLSVTTSFADYSVINQTVGASATNLGVLIWNDDRTTTTTTDVLEIGGYITLCKGASAPSAQVRGQAEEIALYAPYYQKTFAAGTAPASAAGLAGSMQFRQVAGAGAGDYSPSFAYPQGKMRSAPTITIYNPSAAGNQVRCVSASADTTTTATADIGVSSYRVTFTSAPGSSANDLNAFHAQFDARL